MIWGKRRFEDADYGPYMDRLDKLAMADAIRATDYLMVSTKTDKGECNYYVGVPNEDFMRFFDGFSRVDESDLPREIDVFHFGVEGEEFKRLFPVQEARPLMR